MEKTYTLPDGTKFIFEYDHNRMGIITLECMDTLMSLLKATAEPQTDLLVTEYPQDGEVNLIGRGKTEAVVMAYDVYKELTEPQRNMAEDIVRSFDFKAESYRQAKAKTEPQSGARKFLGYVCETCKHRGEEWDSEACDGCCENNDHYEPQTDCRRCKHYATGKCKECFGHELFTDSGYATDCSWQKGE